MNQIIIQPDNLDINKLIQNTDKLSVTFPSKMITKLNNSFTAAEQNTFIINLFGYLQYHPTEDFPINLENVVDLIGFAHKKNAKRTLDNNFIKGEDYKVTVLPKERGRFTEEIVMLNVETFKNLCMMSKTVKGKEIRKYYVKLEQIFNTIVNEERIEYEQKLIQEQQKVKELEQNKPLEKHNMLLREYGNIGSLVYIIKVKSLENGKYIIRVGTSIRGVAKRFQEHRQKYDECLILDCLPSRTTFEFAPLTLLIVIFI